MTTSSASSSETESAQRESGQNGILPHWDNQQSENKGSTSSYDPKFFQGRANAFAVLQATIAALPEIKYSIGLVGLGAAVALVRGFLGNPMVAVIGVAIGLAALTMLLAFAHRARQQTETFRGPARVVFWLTALLLGATLVALFTSFSVAFH